MLGISMSTTAAHFTFKRTRCKSSAILGNGPLAADSREAFGPARSVGRRELLKRQVMETQALFQESFANKYYDVHCFKRYGCEFTTASHGASS